MFIHPQILVELARLRQRDIAESVRGRRPRSRSRATGRHQRDDQ
jgi:hypothetical protein